MLSPVKTHITGSLRDKSSLIPARPALVAERLLFARDFCAAASCGDALAAARPAQAARPRFAKKLRRSVPLVVSEALGGWLECMGFLGFLEGGRHLEYIRAAGEASVPARSFAAGTLHRLSTLD